MIKALSLFLVLLCGIADGFSAKPVGSATNEVIWGAPADQWPSSVWIYKVVPQNFAPPVISNLLELASFTMSEKTKIPGRPPFKDKSILYFTTKDERRHLGIFPPIGWIDYKNSVNEAAMDKSPEGVPSDDEVYRLAQNFLRRFGIDRSQLATKPMSNELRTSREVTHHGRFDKAGDEVKEVAKRGVYFVRRVDGIDLDGIGTRGGVFMNFGNNARLCELQIVWKGLEPFRLVPTISSGDIIDAIKTGRAKWQQPIENASEIKRITVTAVAPRYRGNPGDEEQQYMEPYALVYALLDYGTTNVAANCECPLVRVAKL